MIECAPGEKEGHGIIAEVQEKVKSLAHASDLSVRTALVYDGELAPSVPADRYFDFIIPAADLLLSRE